jgi:diketogulonate reductase-like aldo/keto reductase
VNNIAQKCNTTAAQVILAWGVQRKTVVIPKSENEERLKANLSVGDIQTLSKQALDLCFSLSSFQRRISKRWMRSTGSQAITDLSLLTTLLVVQYLGGHTTRWDGI